MIIVSHVSLFRYLQTKLKDSALSHKVDRLVLHQSSPSASLSSPPPSEQDVRLELKTEGLGTSLGLQRPETSRGRLVRTQNTNLEDAEPPLQTQESSQDEEVSWRKGTKKNMEEEEEEERNLRERKEEWEGERRKVDREVAAERAHLVREKERRMRLLQEELRREEEEEERKLKEENEERLR